MRIAGFLAGTALGLTLSVMPYSNLCAQGDQYRARYYREYGETLIRQGKKERALDPLLRALLLDPSDSAAKGYLKGIIDQEGPGMRERPSAVVRFWSG